MLTPVIKSKNKNKQKKLESRLVELHAFHIRPGPMRFYQLGCFRESKVKCVLGKSYSVGVRIHTCNPFVTQSSGPTGKNET